MKVAKCKTGLMSVMGAVAMTASMFAVSNAHAETSLSGNASVVSKYVFRGLHDPAAENNGATVQAGLDLEHSSGLYLGYWGSTLGYGDNETTGTENDVYAGYGLSLGAVSLDFNVLHYKYLEVDNGDTTEVGFGLGAGPVSLAVSYALNDSSWIAAGNIYTNLSVEASLPKDFGAGLAVGYNMPPEGDSYYHVDISLSHPIAKTGADMSITGIYTQDQGATAVFGVGYEFDI